MVLLPWITKVPALATPALEAIVPVASKVSVPAEMVVAPVLAKDPLVVSAPPEKIRLSALDSELIVLLPVLKVMVRTVAPPTLIVTSSPAPGSKGLLPEPDQGGMNEWGS